MAGVNKDDDDVVGATEGLARGKQGGTDAATASKLLSRQNATDAADADARLSLSLCPSPSNASAKASSKASPSPRPLEEVYLSTVVCRSSFDDDATRTRAAVDHGIAAVASAAAATTTVSEAAVLLSLVDAQGKDQDKAGRVVLSQRRRELRQSPHGPVPVPDPTPSSPFIGATTTTDATISSDAVVAHDTIIGDTIDNDMIVSDLTVVSSDMTIDIDIDALADLRMRPKPGATSLASNFANTHIHNLNHGYHHLQHQYHHHLDGDNDDGDHRHDQHDDHELSPGPAPGCGKGHSFISARHLGRTITGNDTGNGNGNYDIVGNGGGGVHLHPINGPSAVTDVGLGVRHVGGSVVVVGKGMVLGLGTPHSTLR